MPLILGALLVIAGVLGVMAIRRERQADARAAAIVGGDPARAPAIMIHYGCAGCHEIPGVRGPGGRVGPSLKDIGARVYVAGMLTNTPDNLVHWIVDPRGVNPKTAMPTTGITEREARHVAAYLYTLQ